MDTLQQLSKELTPTLSQLAKKLNADLNQEEIATQPAYESDVLQHDYQEFIAPRIRDEKVLLENAFHSLLMDTLREKDQTLTCRLLLIVDLSIYATAQGHCSVQLPMEIVASIFNKTCIEFISQGFGKRLLSSGKRKAALNCNGTLIGKKKPGSTLLSLAHDFIHRSYQFIGDVEEFSGMLRLFVCDSLKLGDSMVSNKLWEVNNSDFYYTLAKNFFTRADEKSFKYGQLYSDYLNVQEFFADPFKVFGSKKFGKKSENSVDFYIDVLKFFLRDLMRMDTSRQRADQFLILDRQQSQVEREKILSEFQTRLYDCDTVVTPEVFNVKIAQPHFRHYLLTQAFVMTHFMHTLCEDMQRPAGTMHKYPVSYRNRTWSGFFSNTKREISAHFREFDPQFSLTLASAVETTECEWVSWKVQGFPERFGEMSPSFSSEEMEKTFQAFNVFYQFKKQFSHSMGTPQLSRLWKQSTGLEKLLVESNAEELKLEEMKSELLRVDSLVDGDPKPDLVEKRNRIHWQTLRLARKMGDWSLKRTDVVVEPSVKRAKLDY